jgi:thiol:disulfide interchange protein
MFARKPGLRVLPIALLCALLVPLNSALTAAPPAGEVHEYSEARDPAADLERAKEAADKAGKHILIEVGGQWCIWCKIMTDFLAAHEDLQKLREDNYVLLKVNFSKGNRNEAFLSRFPKADGYPHLYVLNAKGKVLYSQNTGELDEGRSYNYDRFKAFLTKYAPR